MGIIISQYKDPNKPTSVMERHKAFERCTTCQDGARAIKKVPKRRVSNSTESFLAEVEAPKWSGLQMDGTYVDENWWNVLKCILPE